MTHVTAHVLLIVREPRGQLLAGSADGIGIVERFRWKRDLENGQVLRTNQADGDLMPSVIDAQPAQRESLLKHISRDVIRESFAPCELLAQPVDKSTHVASLPTDQQGVL